MMISSRLTAVLFLLFLVNCATATQGIVSAAKRQLRIRVRQQERLRRRRRHKESSSPFNHQQIESATRSSSPCGSILTLRAPTPDRLSGWFWRDDATSSGAFFNHKSAGMTNPCLHVAVNHHNGHANNWIETTTFASSSSSSSSNMDDSSPSSTDEWWPEAPAQGENNSNNRHNNNWRVLKFQQRVGQGLDCYQRTRDAALAWQFSSTGGDGNHNNNNNKEMGILSVLPTASSRRPDDSPYSCHPHSNALDPRHAAHTSAVQQIWSGPGGRRLATFTAVLRRRRWLPLQMYCINPVHVVYDLVDQRGPGTTYSATAYATGARHWLRGEERVTVALRDNGAVDVQILSLSKPAKSMTGRFVWPLVGKMQRTFFQEQMKALERSAKSSGDGDESIVDGKISVDLPVGSVIRMKR